MKSLVNTSVKLLLCLPLLFLSAQSGQLGAETAISTTELKNILQSRNVEDIRQALNRVKRNQRSEDLLRFVCDLWDGKAPNHETLPWDVINAPRVRIELANVLAQANNNGFVKADRAAIRQYASQVLKGSDEVPKVTAVLTLGLMNNPTDVGILKKEALREHPQTFRAAVIALYEICHRQAALAITDLKSRVEREEYRAFLQQTTKDLVPYKRC